MLSSNWHVVFGRRQDAYAKEKEKMTGHNVIIRNQLFSKITELQVIYLIN